MKTLFNSNFISNDFKKYILPPSPLGESLSRTWFGSRGEGLSIFFLLAIIIFLPLFIQAQFSQSTGTAVYTNLPSSVAGTTGLRVLITYPTTARFSDSGAPLILCLDGGSEGDQLSASDFANVSLENYGFIKVQFNYPGSGTGSDVSGGTYDQRGPTSQQAISDVLNFMMGTTTDVNGQTITNLIGSINPDFSNIGIVANSQGGNIALITIGRNQNTLTVPHWLVNWESPPADRFCNADMGSISDGVNPACDVNTGTFDYSKLKFADNVNSVAEIYPELLGGFYFDVDGNGSYDLGSNGTYDEGEDFAVRGRYWSQTIGNNTSYTSWYSEHIIDSAAANGISVPASATHIPTVDEDYEYWKDRSATYWFDEIAAYRDDFLFTVIATDQDHIQAANTHLHIQLQYDSLINGGITFARVNPDSKYVQYINSSYSDAVDNAAFATINNDNIASSVEPESIDNQDLQIAAALELADRKHFGNYAYNLDGVLVSGTSATSSVPTAHAEGGTLPTSGIDYSDVTIPTSTSSSTCFWTDNDYVTTCREEIASYPDTYEFFINSETGELMYGDPDNQCSAKKLDCIKFCPWNTMDNVISASAVTLTNENDQLPSYILDQYAIASDENKFEDGEIGKWHVAASYVYKDEISNIYDDENSIYQAGLMIDFTMFNWENTDELAYTKWMKTTDFNYYSPNGALLQETNILGVSSTTKENDQNLPYLVAYNASYDDVLYESFENPESNDHSSYSFDELSLNGEDFTWVLNVSTVYGQAHSGKNSISAQYTSGTTLTLDIAEEKNVSSQIVDNGLIVKFWMKIENDTWPTVNLKTQKGSFEKTVQFTEVARTGEWKLFQAQTTFATANPLSETESADDTYNAQIEIGNSSSNPFQVTSPVTQNIYIDDVRLQPANSQLIGYVYDPATFKLLSQFDDQHFASNYQYNQEGKLIRIIRETERGLKTIKETHYNIPLQSKN